VSDLSTDPRIHRFFELLAENVSYNHDVAFYAHLIGLHPDSLSRLLRRETGRGAKRHIDEELRRRAEGLLAAGVKQGEAGRRLGFDDPAHFSRFLSSGRASGGTASGG
jgi:transcriptional regulator GlxA family with amidase domain